MTTCLDCGCNHVLNFFLVEPEEGADGIEDLVMQCPNCGSDDCVEDTVARGHETSTTDNIFEAIEATEMSLSEEEHT